MTYDVIVIGLGGMGSATAYHLARRGHRVLGIEQYTPGHTNGSSHGDSRIIRQLYYEHPLYVPLVRRAYELWGDLGAESGVTLLHVTGGLMLGPPGATIVSGSRTAAIEHRLPYEELDADEIRRRFPVLEVPDHYQGLWDVRAGYVEPETATRMHVRLAERHGATLRFGETATGWTSDGASVTVTTTAGQYLAAKLVITAGAWTPLLVRELALPLTVERQVLVWFDPPVTSGSSDAFAPERFPIYLSEYKPGGAIYGFPRLAAGVKAAIYHEGETGSGPARVRRDVDASDIARVRAALATLCTRLAQAPVRSAVTCLFTNTPDTRFVIDFHPAHANVLVASPCSGHGFKFASAIGEMNADLVTDRPTTIPRDPFAISRFALSSRV